MPILQNPDGMPVLIPDTEVQSFLRKGYRAITPVVTPIPVVAPVQLGPININSASLKELTALESVGTATAKKIQSGRPYTDVADLIAQFPDINWIDLPINFDATDSEPTV